MRLVDFALCRALALGALATLGVVGRSDAQSPAGPPPPAAAAAPALSPGQLETLVAPIALYPDELLAIALPAATTPIEVVKAQRFLDRRKGNPGLQPDPSMPEPVRNLLNYPDVVTRLNDDLDWTERLGDAVTSQQRDVLMAVQAFRRRVQTAGNLKSDDKQKVTVTHEIVTIAPANPQVIYVPQYQPTTVVVQQAAPPVVYSQPAPVYYYPYPPGTALAAGLVAATTTAFVLSWWDDEIHHGVHYDDIEQLQQNRMNYASGAREDWQAYGTERQESRQQATQERQTQRQEQIGRAPTERPVPAQTPRQPASGAAQTQPAAPRSQPWQSQRRPGQGGASGQPSTMVRPGDPQFGQGGGLGAGQPGGGAQLGGGQFGGAAQPGAGGAFGGMGSGASASHAQQRGMQSAGGRFGQSQDLGGGGGRFGGGGRGGRR